MFGRMPRDVASVTVPEIVRVLICSARPSVESTRRSILCVDVPYPFALACTVNVAAVKPDRV